MKNTRRLMALVLAFVMVLGMTACGSNEAKETTAAAEATEAAVAENTVYRSLYASEVTTLNYLITTQENEMSIAANVIDCLVEYDNLGNIEPALALEWSSNEDATVWTFKLRQGVKWVDKDGNEVAEVTAHDFVTSAHYVCDAANAAAGASQYTSIVAGAEAYNEWTAYQLALPNAVDGTDENGNAVKYVTNDEGEQEILAPVDEATADAIGVKAIDDYTLEYTLTKPCPYFVSMVSTGPYMPSNAAFMAECGDKFGTSNEYLLYCGAYVLSTYEPQNQRILTKNASYWEADKVYITSVVNKYNAEAASVATTMYLAGDIDTASVSADLLNAMLADPQYANLIHPTRADTSYSYWYLFNFDPNFDAEYEPENWKIAVNNENFRKSIYAAMNRVAALSAQDAMDPASLVSNTVTPAGFSAASADFTTYGDLANFANGDYYNTEKALAYKAAAIEEMTAAGATFPVKVLVLYNPTSTSWANESQIVEQNLESVLGTDYIDIIVQAGPDTGFLNERRAGNYALMKCNWGADYADPETWTDPFNDSSKYNFIYKSQDPTTMALYAEYTELVNIAKDITNDMDARYAAFAKAEAMLLEHAFALPIHTSSRSYQMSNLNPFEGQYAPFGVAYLRYKDQHLYATSMSLADWQAAYADWQANLAK
ncbi:MAG: peptide ABC transporter substrate-binding protein [Oscillospiraceae bacterium]|nr:peptide ABC transporter substrate-binding protein [Oscillospiraceae bacterium]